MARTYDATYFEIENSGDTSNELGVQLRDADKIIVFAPAVLAENNVRLQVYSGSGWFDYDTTGFSAGGYREFEARGLKYRLKLASGTVAATRTFQVVKRVGA